MLTSVLVVLSSIVLGLLISFLLAPRIVRAIGGAVGIYLHHKTAGRRAHILERVEEDEKAFASEGKKKDSDEEWENVDALAAGTAGNGQPADREWEGIVGFFHPFCNAGGGGERVLWAAIRATQQRWPNSKCVVYTGDHDVDKKQILERVENQFNIHLHPPSITFLYLTTRRWVLASTWPNFTLLGQSIGSIIMGYDALSLLVPDIFVDTMGYAFSLGLCKILFPTVPTGAYVHYPTISTDMLGSLNVTSSATTGTGTMGLNAGKGSGRRGQAKKVYWELFAMAYSRVGAAIDVIVTNSSWTQSHIRSLWGPYRTKTSSIEVLFPPVAVEELELEVDVSAGSEKLREKVLLYIAQFRPEKNHQLIIQSFAEFMKTKTPATKGAKLVLVGSVRDDSDSKRVYELRLLVNELKIKESVEFHLDASWPEILGWLRKASVGVNGMWNEHFGIGVVEYQAAGLISVVHDSGGPRRDIVIDVDGKPTGFHATTSKEFADGFEKALSLGDIETLAMRKRARKSAKRFTEEEFAKGWVGVMDKLVRLT